MGKKKRDCLGGLWKTQCPQGLATFQVGEFRQATFQNKVAGMFREEVEDEKEKE